MRRKSLGRNSMTVTPVANSVRPRASGDPGFRTLSIWPWVPACAGTNGTCCSNHTLLAGDDEEIGAAAHDRIGFEPQAAGACALAGLDVVFVAVPGADE